MAWECEDCGYPGCGDANCLDNRAHSQAAIEAVTENMRRKRLLAEAAENPNLLKGGD